MSIKIFRACTISGSWGLLAGQLKFLSNYYEITAVSSPGEQLNETGLSEGVRTIAIPMRRRISLFEDFVSLIRLVLLFYKEKPDMVHSITPKAGLLSMLAGWITRVPVRMHTFTGLIFPTATGVRQKILIATDRLTCFCATHVNPEGEGVKRDLINYKITHKPLRIIANGNVNGIDLSYFQPLTQKVEPHDGFVFCFVGRIVRDKGINELVHVFTRLYAERKDLRLILVGPFEKDLDPVALDVEKLILNHSAISFMGWQKDVRPYFAMSDALVFPSYREGFPNVVMQAGAMGLPSIVTDINGCNEIIVDGENGIIIPPKDEEALYKSMSYFLDNSDKVKIMAEKARPMIQSRYERKKVWDALLEEYRYLLGK
ncbi:glycosyltransferase family 4 protein [Parabacteroides distasonis]|uniref:glycosyltransferase family 4 protein n=1 Tax=Parabacteroides distasonis TaxID=823 RepID=UPI00321C2D1C